MLHAFEVEWLPQIVSEGLTNGAYLTGSGLDLVFPLSACDFEHLQGMQMIYILELELCTDLGSIRVRKAVDAR